VHVIDQRQVDVASVADTRFARQLRNVVDAYFKQVAGTKFGDWRFLGRSLGARVGGVRGWLWTVQMKVRSAKKQEIQRRLTIKVPKSIPDTCFAGNFEQKCSTALNSLFRDLPGDCRFSTAFCSRRLQVFAVCCYSSDTPSDMRNLFTHCERSAFVAILLALWVAWPAAGALGYKGGLV